MEMKKKLRVVLTTLLLVVMCCACGFTTEAQAKVKWQGGIIAVNTKQKLKVAGMKNSDLKWRITENDSRRGKAVSLSKTGCLKTLNCGSAEITARLDGKLVGKWRFYIYTQKAVDRYNARKAKQAAKEAEEDAAYEEAKEKEAEEEQLRKAKLGYCTDSNNVHGANGDVTIEVIKEPTCIENGSANYTCNVCGYKWTGTYGNKYTTLCNRGRMVVKLGETCSDTAYYTQYCTVCGEQMGVINQEGESHVYENITRDGDYYYATCSRCGKPAVGAVRAQHQPQL